MVRPAPTAALDRQLSMRSDFDIRRSGKEMIGVDKVEDIRRRARRGESVSGIAAATGVSGPTVRKYIAAGDLSPRPPATRGRTSSPMMEPYAETVEGWLREDLRVWRKQRHTARRIHDRLVYGDAGELADDYVAFVEREGREPNPKAPALAERRLVHALRRQKDDLDEEQFRRVCQARC